MITYPQSLTVVSLLKFHKTGKQVTLLLGKIRGGKTNKVQSDTAATIDT